MANFTVIQAVGQTLSDLLWAYIEGDPIVHNNNIINRQERISLRSPHDLKEQSQNPGHLSLFLYRIVEDGCLKNQPFQPADGNFQRHPPLALDLFYLVTPNTGDVKNDHLLLGKVMQVFYDNAIIKKEALQGALRENVQELRLLLNPISMEDITKLWNAFMMSYRLSVSYEVRVVYLDSARPLQEAPRVTDREARYEVWG
jgi:hypothetical protein